MSKHLLFIFLFISLRFSLSAQHPYYYKIDDELGLPSNEVYEIIQDDFGYMWIGCDAGLYRYDGFNFKAYTNPKQNGKAISYLRKDTKGRIWCKNFNGQIYRVENEQLKLIIDNSGLESRSSQFAIDDDLNLWLANKDKLEKYNDEGKNQTIVYTATGQKENYIYEICYSNNKIYFTQNNEGLLSYDLSKKNILNYHFPNTPTTTYGRFNLTPVAEKLYILSEDLTNNLYSLFVLRDSVKHLQTNYFGKQNTRAYYVREDNEGGAWVCTSKGAYMLGNESVKLFEDEKISFMYHDKEGNYWFTSLHNGIFVVPNLEVKSHSIIKNSKCNLTALFARTNGDLICGDYSGNLYLKNKTENNINSFGSASDKYGAVKKIIEFNKHTLISRIELSIINSTNNELKNETRVNARDMLIYNDSLFSISFAGFSIRAFNDLLLKESKTALYVRRIGGRALYCDSINKQILVAFNDGLYAYNNGKLKELLFNKEHVYAQQIAGFKTGAWILTGNAGVLVYENGELKHNNLSKYGIDEKGLRYIFNKTIFSFAVI